MRLINLRFWSPSHLLFDASQKPKGIKCDFKSGIIIFFYFLYLLACFLLWLLRHDGQNDQIVPTFFFLSAWSGGLGLFRQWSANWWPTSRWRGTIFLSGTEAYGASKKYLIKDCGPVAFGLELIVFMLEDTKDKN